MPGFPDTFRDLSGFSSQGVEYSTPSNTAVKMLDALINQAIYHYNDQQLGGWGGTVNKMFEADPEFVMGKIFTLGLECFAANREKTEEPRKKLFDLSKKSEAMNLTNLEVLHMKAAVEWPLKITTEPWLHLRIFSPSIHLILMPSTWRTSWH